ncbi:FliH/SctL family protein [Persephonella sp.]
MPSLDIEDFGQPLKKPQSDEMSKEEIEKYYQNQIKQIKQEYEKKLEESYKKGFSEGYSKAREEVSRELEEKCRQEVEEKLRLQQKQLNEEFQNLRNQIVSLLKEIHNKYIQHVQFTDELILSVLEEIMEYLYVDPSNVKFVSDEIEKIIDDLKTAPSITVEVSPQLKEFIGDVGEYVKIIENKEIEGGDFVIKIENVQFESRFKEKMKIVKDEIKREIKKNSPL